ncbi:hypothetical protein M3894_002910 [Vibrio metschnikovii]|nr:hypothetical protein [Vibrio metschnikovii]
MTINFTTEEYGAMKTELKANAFASLIRLMPMERGDAIFHIARICDVTYGSVKDWEKFGVPNKHVNTMLDIAKQNDIRIYKHQLSPTSAIINQWLTWCFEIDKDRHASKRIFGHWNASMKKGHVA